MQNTKKTHIKTLTIAIQPLQQMHSILHSIVERAKSLIGTYISIIQVVYIPLFASDSVQNYLNLNN